MTHLEELQLIKEFSQNVTGDDTTKLEKEIIAMEMSLGIIKRSKKEEMEQHKRRKANKGYIWKSGRDIDTKKRNYADKILKSSQHKNRKKKKMKEDKMRQLTKTNAQSLCSSIAIQAEELPNTINDETKEESLPAQIKKCCYHCFALFVLTNATIQRENRYFCTDQCLAEYIKSTLITCAANECQIQFARCDGSRFHGQWYCKLHFTECCVNEMGS